MSKIKKVAEGKNYTTVNAGSLSELNEKIFLKDATGATSTEISLNKMAPGEESSFFHTHKKNEETYIILKGKGDFQVDDDSFPISEGSVVRVAPAGKRSMRSALDEPLVYIVIQSHAGSLIEYSFGDGEIVQHEKKW